MPTSHLEPVVIVQIFCVENVCEAFVFWNVCFCSVGLSFVLQLLTIDRWVFQDGFDLSLALLFVTNSTHSSYKVGTWLAFLPSLLNLPPPQNTLQD